MACKRCQETGQTKTIHFERCGRWETRIFCDHSYKRAQINENELGHVLTPSKVQPVTNRKPPAYRREPYVKYTEEMDAFLLLHYPRDKRRYRHNAHIMDKVRNDFQAKFHLPLTKGQLIGRWHRLKELANKAMREETRGIPSLPVLKFMSNGGGS